MSSKIVIHIHSSLENEQAKVMYAMTKLLSDLNLLMKDPHSVVIERTEREPIYPCGRSKSADPLNLSQLEFMEEKGQFFFEKPIQSLNVTLNNDKQIQIKFD